MKIRVNFTIDIDPEQYREALGIVDTNEGIRAELQATALVDFLHYLRSKGVHVPAHTMNRKGE